jgi:hypothetical protein
VKGEYTTDIEWEDSYSYLPPLLGLVEYVAPTTRFTGNEI